MVSVRVLLPSLVTWFTLVSCVAANKACPPGHERNNNKCIQCLPGYYGDIYSSECYKCPDNSYTLVHGVYAEHLCIPCGSDEVFDPSLNRCKKCAVGMVPGTGGRCIRCKPGQFQSSGTCYKCDPTSITTVFNARECTVCAEGMVSNTQRTKCIAPNCPSGKQWNLYSFPRSKCEICKNNSYKNEKSKVCKSCVGRMAVSKPNRNGCFQCKPGTYLYNSISIKTTNYKNIGFQCKKCPPNTSTNGYSKLICKHKNKPCPKGTFVDGDGDCNVCDKGYHYNKNSNKCFRCPKNHVSKGKLRKRCINCGANSVIHQSDLSRCDCKKGYLWNRKLGKCLPCKKGTYYFSHSKYRASCLPCSDAENFVTKGKCYSGLAQLQCKVCPKGFNSYATKGAKCIKNITCPKGFIVSGSNTQFPGFNVCVSQVNGCPKHLKPVVKQNFYLVCADAEENIICPKGHFLDKSYWGCYPNNQ